jgi:threonine/homoserine/homoserine lactone efflux protein
MVESTQILEFATATLILLMVPGPAVTFVLARSLAGGRRAGLISQSGLCAGLLVHVAAAVLGLSAVVTNSAVAFAVLKYVGAAYLIWLGVRALRSGDDTKEADPTSRSSLRPWRLFVDGFVIDAFNPKPALFFLAFLPQFVNPESADLSRQIAALGVLFIVLAFATGALYALLAGSVAPRMKRSSRLRRRTRQASGMTYLGLGALAAVWKR